MIRQLHVKMLSDWMCVEFTFPPSVMRLWTEVSVKVLPCLLGKPSFKAVHSGCTPDVEPGFSNRQFLCFVKNLQSECDVNVLVDEFSANEPEKKNVFEENMRLHVYIPVLNQISFTPSVRLGGCVLSAWEPNCCHTLAPSQQNFAETLVHKENSHPTLFCSRPAPRNGQGFFPSRTMHSVW